MVSGCATCGPTALARCSACKSRASPTCSPSPARAVLLFTPTWSWRSSNTSTGSPTVSSICAESAGASARHLPRRSVATRLGVSPVQLYSRVGNKDALVNAVAERMLHDLAPPATDDEPWPTYAARWARELRSRLGQAPDARLILGARRSAYVEAS